MLPCVLLDIPRCYFVRNSFGVILKSWKHFMQVGARNGSGRKFELFYGTYARKWCHACFGTFRDTFRLETVFWWFLGPKNNLGRSALEMAPDESSSACGRKCCRGRFWTFRDAFRLETGLVWFLGPENTSGWSAFETGPRESSSAFTTPVHENVVVRVFGQSAMLFC